MTKKRTRDEKILDASEASIFYCDSDGQAFRIDFTDRDEGCFLVTHEESGEEHRILPADVLDTDSFIVGESRTVGDL